MTKKIHIQILTVFLCLVRGGIFAPRHLGLPKASATRFVVKYKHMRSFIAFVLMSFIGLLALPFVALAIDYNGIAARPAVPTPGDERTASWFVYALAPGEIKNDVLVVQNNTNVEQDLELYPADSAPTTGDGFALKQRVQKMDKVGSWVKLEKTELKLAPHAEERIAFSVRVPENESMGLWAGAIMVAAAETQAKVAGVSFNLRLGVRMYVTVAQKVKAAPTAPMTGPVAVIVLSATILALAGVFPLVWKRRQAAKKKS
jgi:hypothetical protein